MACNDGNPNGLDEHRTDRFSLRRLPFLSNLRRLLLLLLYFVGWCRENWTFQFVRLSLIQSVYAKHIQCPKKLTLGYNIYTGCNSNCVRQMSTVNAMPREIVEKEETTIGWKEKRENENQTYRHRHTAEDEDEVQKEKKTKKQKNIVGKRCWSKKCELLE